MLTRESAPAGWQPSPTSATARTATHCILMLARQHAASHTAARQQLLLARQHTASHTSIVRPPERRWPATPLGTQTSWPALP